VRVVSAGSLPALPLGFGFFEFQLSRNRMIGCIANGFPAGRISAAGNI
jgi:hypothetical protein